MMKRYAVILLLLAAVWTGACTRVSPGYVGIQVSYAGSDRGVKDFPTTTGWVLYNPIFSTVMEWPTFVQTAKWTANLKEGSESNEEITFTNKDGMQFAADISLSYHLEASKVPHFYVQFRTDHMDTFTHGFLRNVARDAFDQNGGKYTIEQIMGDNAEFIKNVTEIVQKKVEPFGVIIDQFGLIGAPRPPQQIQQAINDKAAAKQTAEKKENELRQANADAAKVVATAKGAAAAAVAAAEGEAEAIRIQAEANAKGNRLLSESITDKVLELKRLEKWDGQLPYINGGTTNPFVSIEPKKQQ
jgi:regulator of protease activity HflC (stomatin/prohibitin superfamily)